MRKYLFGCVCAGLLACTAFATEGRVIPVTDYHHEIHHPYTYPYPGYYWQPHAYIYDSFDHDHHYPYNYHWSRHRWHAPYYSEKDKQTDSTRSYHWQFHDGS